MSINHTLTVLDRRLTAAGMRITVTQLIAIWADHYPATLPVPATCPGCGHTYNPQEPLCPTATVVRPLLQRRRYEVPGKAFARLTFIQHADLFGKHVSTATTRPTRAAAVAVPVTPELFDTAAYRTRGA